MVYCKRILILFFIFITLFCSFSFSAQVVQNTEIVNGQSVQYDNNYLTIRQMQIDTQDAFINYLFARSRENYNDVKNFAVLILNGILSSKSENNKYIYVEGSGTSYSGKDYEWRVVEYVFEDKESTVIKNLNFDGIGFINVPTNVFTDTVNRYVFTNNSFSTLTNSEYGDCQIPAPCQGVVSPRWIDLFDYLGWLPNSPSQQIIAKLNELISASNNSEQINQTIREESEKINTTLEEQNKLQQEANDLQQEQNDFLKSEASDSDIDVSGFNTVDVDDPTSSFLTGIFNTIYNSITSWKSKDIILPVPNTDESITIQSDSTVNFLNSINATWVITIVSAVYYFIVARFIIFYIQRLIDAIKSGNILNSSKSDNITTDLL